MYVRQILCLVSFVIANLLFGGTLRAATFAIDGDVIGVVTHYSVAPKDNLPEIARRFDVGIIELLAINPGLSPKTLEAGTVLIIPTMHVLPAIRQGIVLNLSEFRLFYFIDAIHVMSVPIGIGREGRETPLGITSIIRKRANPVWVPPASIRKELPNLPPIVPAGPDNPLGQYALSLGIPSYAIHGTNRPYSIGKRTSHGCIRLYPEDIAALFNAVDVATPVTIIDAPFKLGWKGSELFLEITPTQLQSDAIMKYRKPPLVKIPELGDAIRLMGEGVAIDWKVVDRAMILRSGLPVMIGKKSIYQKLQSTLR